MWNDSTRNGWTVDDGKILNARRVQITPAQQHDIENEERKGEPFAIAKAAEITGTDAAEVSTYAVQETEQGIFLKVRLPDFTSEADKANYEKAQAAKAAKAAEAQKAERIAGLKSIIAKAQAEIDALQPAPKKQEPKPEPKAEPKAEASKSKI